MNIRSATRKILLPLGIIGFIPDRVTLINEIQGLITIYHGVNVTE